MTALAPSLLDPGRNCHRVTRARRAALLIDGEAYFRNFALAALRATHSLVVVGWDFHSRTRLHLNQPGVPDLLGDFLNFLVKRNRRLRIFILVWDSPLGFGRTREPPVSTDGGWQPRRRIEVRYDADCPLGAALHQKMVVIDGVLAFCGGIDLTLGRWDTSAHLAGDPRRTRYGEQEPYAPVHDAMLVVDGGAARALQSVASDRWQSATGRALPTAYSDNDPWPPLLAPMFAEVDIAVARTMPARPAQPAVVEVERLYLDMIAAAKRCIYVENQYFTSKVLGEALAARLAEPHGPEVVVVSRLSSSGWLEAPTMAALRTLLLRELYAADAHGRFSAWYLETPGEPACDVHSKIMIVDDAWLRVGSANFSNRSMGLDGECDLVVEARANPAARTAISAARDTLVAEHLGVAVHDVRDALALAPSLGGVIALFANGPSRTLRRFERLDEPSPAMVALANGVADPQRPPLPLYEIMAGVPTPTGAPVRRTNPAQRPSRLEHLLGGALLGILIGTLVATLLEGELPSQQTDPHSLDLLWLLMVTLAAIATAKWTMRRRIGSAREREQRS